MTHLHLQLDPGGYGTSGPYTVEWQNLSLIGDLAAPIQITSQTLDPTNDELTLTWTSTPDANYTVWQTSNLPTNFTPLVTDIASQGSTTTTTVTMPAGSAGFVRVQKP